MTQLCGNPNESRDMTPLACMLGCNGFSNLLAPSETRGGQTKLVVLLGVVYHRDGEYRYVSTPPGRLSIIRMACWEEHFCCNGELVGSFCLNGVNPRPCPARQLMCTRGEAHLSVQTNGTAGLCLDRGAVELGQRDLSSAGLASRCLQARKILRGDHVV